MKAAAKRTPGDMQSSGGKAGKTCAEETLPKRDDCVNKILEKFSEVKSSRIDTSRSRARSHLQKILKNHSEADLMAAVENYRITCEFANTEEKYRRGAGNFFGRDCDYENYLPGEFDSKVLQSEADREYEKYLESPEGKAELAAILGDEPEN